MSAVPAAVSETILASEVANCQPWADRHGWELELDRKALTLDVQMKHPSDGSVMLLRGVFDSYRGLPPVWLFLDPETGEMTASSWPTAGLILGQSSIFHSHGVICAHWSRKAYKEMEGPHDNWGTLAGWADVRDGVHAENVGEMLAAIHLHLSVSPGRVEA